MNLPFDCQLMCYKVGSHAVASVPLAFPCVFRKFKVGERFEPKIGGGERRSTASYGTLTIARLHVPPNTPREAQSTN